MHNHELLLVTLLFKYIYIIVDIIIISIIDEGVPLPCLQIKPYNGQTILTMKVNASLYYLLRQHTFQHL